MFLSTISKTRKGELSNTGLLIKLKDNSNSFYFAFSFMFRFQRVIFDEIDNLIDKTEIESLVDIINAKKIDEKSECLSEDQVKKFNKYLLIQGLIKSGTLNGKSNCHLFIKKILDEIQSSNSNINKLIDYNNKLYDLSLDVFDKVIIQ